LSPLGDALSVSWKGAQWVDNIVLLSYAQLATGLRRAIAVPKARGRRTVQLMREYVIEAGGLALIDTADTLASADDGPLAGPSATAFASYLSLLSRSPTSGNRHAGEGEGEGEEPLDLLESSALPPSAELHHSQATE
jgi:hypothetical protein